MIIDSIFQLLIVLGRNLTEFFEPVTELPFGLDPYVVQGVTLFKAFSQFFPIYNTVLSAFVIWLGYKIIKKILTAVPMAGRIME